jgi:hypothetical protein
MVITLEEEVTGMTMIAIGMDTGMIEVDIGIMMMVTGN